MAEIKQIIWLDQTDSTNNCALEGTETHASGTVWAAECQTNGRGQRGNKWNSAPGENLTFSLLLKPGGIYAQDQFIISVIATLGIVKYLRSKGLQASIKWPNDIYIGNRKICGILIENAVTGAFLTSSIVGIGLNVNQLEFPQWLPNPTSMSIESGQTYNTHTELELLTDCILSYYKKIQKTDPASAAQETGALFSLYHKALYRLGTVSRFLEIPPEFSDKPLNAYPEAAALAKGHIVEAKIIGVTPQGCLILQHTSSPQVKTYAFKEISYII